jgi:hypothetical protein
VVLASALLAGCDGAGVWLWERPSREERQAIESRYTRWQTALDEERFADAYAVMSPRYRAAHPLAEFADEFKDLSWVRLKPGYILRVHGSDARLYPFDDNGWFEIWNGPDYEWEEIGGEWYLTGDMQWYTD